MQGKSLGPRVVCDPISAALLKADVSARHWASSVVCGSRAADRFFNTREPCSSAVGTKHGA